MDSPGGRREAVRRPGRRAGPAALAWTVLDSPVGRLVLAASERGLCAVDFGDPEPVLARLAAGPVAPPALAGPAGAAASHLAAAAAQLEEYFAGRRRGFALSLDLRGTPFQRRVWRLLQEIPYGETRSYGWVAAAAGRPGAARAVGQACGCNPVAIVVPCHRVVASGGGLGGYGGGLAIKRYLLSLEGVAV